ncbi:serine/threonine-protein kinase [Parafrankia sp. FMc2]|uniref:serine/threonine-protein kinase n=1 Tax=Parafrankia sp. FMc2 TaxID=3233196 RepID=UPI0034D64E9E
MVTPGPTRAPAPEEFLSPLWSDDPCRVGPFLLRGRLGAGGMGTVYLGHAHDRQPVAVKVIRADMASDPDFRRRFEREVAAMRRVESRFTAPLITADVGAPRPWLATAYVHGPTLRASVERNGPLPAESVLMLAAGVAEALLAIHGAGVIHRDLKPANVLLTLDGPRVIDFGIARAADHSGSTTTGRIIGSPAYMSPEQARGERVDAASDVFALGSVLAFAATGRNAFGEGNTADVIYRIVREKPVLTGVGGDLRGLIEACLAKVADQRPGPAEVLARCLAEPSTVAQTTTWLPVPVLAEISQRQRHPDVAVTPPALPAPRAPTGPGTPEKPAPAAAFVTPPPPPAPPVTAARRPPRTAVAAVCVLAACALAGALTATPARTILRPWELLPGRGDGSEAPADPSSPFSPAGSGSTAVPERLPGAGPDPRPADGATAGAPTSSPDPAAGGPAPAPNAGADADTDDRDDRDGLPADGDRQPPPEGQRQTAPPGHQDQPSAFPWPQVPSPDRDPDPPAENPSPRPTTAAPTAVQVSPTPEEGSGTAPPQPSPPPSSHPAPSRSAAPAEPTELPAPTTAPDDGDSGGGDPPSQDIPPDPSAHAGPQP